MPRANRACMSTFYISVSRRILISHHLSCRLLLVNSLWYSFAIHYVVIYFHRLRLDISRHRTHATQWRVLLIHHAWRACAARIIPDSQSIRCGRISTMYARQVKLNNFKKGQTSLVSTEQVTCQYCSSTFTRHIPVFMPRLRVLVHHASCESG